jgi:aspartyl-tRNA(Asn)/glutamyl-tRNA(Gln) amidotransferase subunit C
MAALARLDLARGLAPEEAEPRVAKIASEFSQIVGYMDILNEVDTAGVAPLYSPMLEPQLPREDEPRPRPQTDAKAAAILEAAPRRSGRFFVVPRVV